LPLPLCAIVLAFFVSVDAKDVVSLWVTVALLAVHD